MDLHLAGRRALITGGSKGIGRATAEVFAEEGMDLLLVSRSADVLEATAQSIRARHQVQVETLAADLSQDSEVLRLAAHAGEVDVLVNNAGAIPPGTLLSVDTETWRRAWDLKVFGFIALSREIYRHMANRKSGVIVNIIGAAGEKFPPGYIAGAAGNASLMAFTRALGHASQKDGIRVVGINPGATETERQTMLLRHRAQTELGDAERYRELLAGNPFGRIATAHEIGYAAAFLASPRSAYTTGTILTIDGGA